MVDTTVCQNYNGNFIKMIQILWVKKIQYNRSYYQTFNKLVQFYKSVTCFYVMYSNISFLLYVNVFNCVAFVFLLFKLFFLLFVFAVQ